MPGSTHAKAPPQWAMRWHEPRLDNSGVKEWEVLGGEPPLPPLPRANRPDYVPPDIPTARIPQRQPASPWRAPVHPEPPQVRMGRMLPSSAKLSLAKLLQESAPPLNPWNRDVVN